MPTAGSETTAIANSQGNPKPRYGQYRKRAAGKKDATEKSGGRIETPVLADIPTDTLVEATPKPETIFEEIVKKKRSQHKRDVTKLTTTAAATEALAPKSDVTTRNPTQTQPEQKTQPV